MKVISSREFRDSQKKYLDLATSENPSPSNDPYFDNPYNISQIEIAIQEVKEGKISPLTKENQKGLLGI